MTLKLGFESTEEILGLVVAKPDIKNSEQELPIHTDVTICTGILKSIREGIIQLEKHLDSYCYLADTIDAIKTKNAVSKATVKSIDELYPELLGTVAHINDFTDIPTRTGLDILTRFLDKKLNEVKDQILVTYTDSVYKHIEKLNTITATIDPVVVNNQLTDMKTNLNKTIESLSNKKCLMVFKDGVLHKVMDSLFVQEYREALKVLNIPGLDMSSVDKHINYIKKLLSLLAEIDPNIDLSLCESYGGLLKAMLAISENEICSELSKVAEVTDYIVSEKKLVTEPATYRDTLVTKVLSNPYVLKMDKQTAQVAKYLLVKALFEEVLDMNFRHLNV